MMITQHQARKLASASEFEKLELIDDMIKSLQKTKKETRAQLIEDGKAEYDKHWRDEFVTKGHWVRTFKRVG
jgi:hypothetical protein